MQALYHQVTFITLDIAFILLGSNPKEPMEGLCWGGTENQYTAQIVKGFSA